MRSDLIPVLGQPGAWGAGETGRHGTVVKAPIAATVTGLEAARQSPKVARLRGYLVIHNCGHSLVTDDIAVMRQYDQIAGDCSQMALAG